MDAALVVGGHDDDTDAELVRHRLPASIRRSTTPSQEMARARS